MIVSSQNRIGEREREMGKDLSFISQHRPFLYNHLQKIDDNHSSSSSSEVMAHEGYVGMGTSKMLC